VKLPPAIEQALNATGKPWEIAQGKRHLKIKLEGRMVGILPLSGFQTTDMRCVKNTISQIKRAARGQAWSRHHG